MTLRNSSVTQDGPKVLLSELNIRNGWLGGPQAGVDIIGYLLGIVKAGNRPQMDCDLDIDLAIQLFPRGVGLPLRTGGARLTIAVSVV